MTLDCKTMSDTVQFDYRDNCCPSEFVDEFERNFKVEGAGRLAETTVRWSTRPMLARLYALLSDALDEETDNKESQKRYRLHQLCKAATPLTPPRK